MLAAGRPTFWREPPGLRPFPCPADPARPDRLHRIGKDGLALRWAEANDAEIICAIRCYSIGGWISERRSRWRPSGRAFPIICRYPGCPGAYECGALCQARPRRWRIDRRAGQANSRCRGSGFYLKSFLAPVADEIAVSAEIRAGVLATLERGACPALLRSWRNSIRAASAPLTPQIREGWPGRSKGAWPRAGSCRNWLRIFARLQPVFADWDVRVSELRRGPEDLARRAAERIKAMLREGLVEEVKGLLGRGLLETRVPRGRSATRGHRDARGRLAAEGLASEIEKTPAH